MVAEPRGISHLVWSCDRTAVVEREVSHWLFNWTQNCDLAKDGNGSRKQLHLFMAFVDTLTWLHRSLAINHIDSLHEHLFHLVSAKVVPNYKCFFTHWYYKYNMNNRIKKLGI